MRKSSSIEFYVDPACPWTWVTSRWLVSVAPERSLDIVWRPFSREVRDGGARLSDGIPEQFRAIAQARRALERTVLGLLELIRREHGNSGVGIFYQEFGFRLNDPATAADGPAPNVVRDSLLAAGLEPGWEARAGESELQDAVRQSTEAAMRLVGRDAMTPVIVIAGEQPTAISGPIIDRVPELASGLSLWDAVREIIEIPAFFELRRIRPEVLRFPAGDKRPAAGVIGGAS